MDDEPRFFGDVLPPDDPRPGDVWLANGVRRVRREDSWDPGYIPRRSSDQVVEDVYRAHVRAMRSRPFKSMWERRKQRKLNDTSNSTVLDTNSK